MQTSDLAHEWSLLQNQFDSYEKYSLLIKLASTGLLAAAFFSARMNLVILVLVLVLWLQDGIWKTFQSRIETRLLQLEEELSGGDKSRPHATVAYQFNSLYQQNRPSSLGLVSEYLRQTLRPTVAFPHAVLALLLLAQWSQ